MKRTSPAHLGIAGITLLLISIAAAISQAPWFNWVNNALSDLGNLNNGNAAIFNVGLLSSGLLIVLYSLIGMRGHAPKSAYFLAFTGFSMQLTGLLCENYGRIHFNVSILLFVALLFASLAYFAEKRYYPALLVLLAIPLWIIHFQDILVPGAAIPEIISTLLAFPWVIRSSIKAHRGE
jgi:hypothetical membrane protein